MMENVSVALEVPLSVCVYFIVLVISDHEFKNHDSLIIYMNNR